MADQCFASLRKFKMMDMKWTWYEIMADVLFSFTVACLATARMLPKQTLIIVCQFFLPASASPAAKELSWIFAQNPNWFSKGIATFSTGTLPRLCSVLFLWLSTQLNGAWPGEEAPTIAERFNKELAQLMKLRSPGLFSNVFPIWSAQPASLTRIHPICIFTLLFWILPIKHPKEFLNRQEAMLLGEEEQVVHSCT